MNEWVGCCSAQDSHFAWTSFWRHLTLDDWHAHDGYLKAPTVTSWEQLSTALTSDDALRKRCSADTLVYTATFPDDYGSFFFGLPSWTSGIGLRALLMLNGVTL